MNDEETFDGEADFTRLEQTLRQFSPAPLPAALQYQVQAAAPSRPDHISPLADNLLALWTLGGALAASVVIALTVLQLAGSPRPAPRTSQEVALHQQTVQEIERLIASR